MKAALLSKGQSGRLVALIRRVTSLVQRDVAPPPIGQQEWPTGKAKRRGQKERPKK